MSQVNDIRYLQKIRPKRWLADSSASKYLSDLELWAKQVYENLTGVTRIRTYTVANLPDASDFSPDEGGAALIYVSDESGGAVVAFSDGANWRRVTDRQVVS